MRKVLSYLSAFMLSLFLLGCSSDDNYTDVSNLVGGYTMVNAYESEGAVVFAADGRPVQNPYYPLPYQMVGYVNLWEGTRLLTVHGAGSNKVLANKTKKIENKQFYTSFIGGNEKKVVNFITEDKIAKVNPLNEAKQSGVRFFNLSSDEVIATVEFNDKPSIKEFVMRPQDSEETVLRSQEFRALDSNTYKITIKDKDNKELVSKENVKLDASRFYSIILIGSKDSSEKPYYIGVVNQAVR
ncbi:MAG: hypothetical protein ACRCVU_08505 [Flavobacterium sp.]